MGHNLIHAWCRYMKQHYHSFGVVSTWQMSNIHSLFWSPTLQISAVLNAPISSPASHLLMFVGLSDGRCWAGSVVGFYHVYWLKTQLPVTAGKWAAETRESKPQQSSFRPGKPKQLAPSMLKFFVGIIQCQLVFCSWQYNFIHNT